MKKSVEHRLLPFMQFSQILQGTFPHFKSKMSDVKLLEDTFRDSIQRRYNTSDIDDMYQYAKSLR
jgi:hypothetical protein